MYELGSTSAKYHPTPHLGLQYFPTMSSSSSLSHCFGIQLLESSKVAHLCMLLSSQVKSDVENGIA